MVEHSSENETVFGSSRKQRGAAKHVFGGSENRICWLSFEFLSPHVIKRRSNGGAHLKIHQRLEPF